MDLDALRAALPSGALVSDPALFDRYARDVTGRYDGAPSAVARPPDEPAVAALLRACNEGRVAVVPQGGNTGLVGGAIPFGGEVVLSLGHLASVEEVDRASKTVVAGAGATLGAVQAAVRAADMELPIDFAARDGATIGGMVATDAGGALTMRHGTMRALVAGLRVVLADGTVVDRLHRPPKDGTGFDVTALMCGSEGTLGVVTAARLKLVTAPRHRTVALAGLASLDDAVVLTAALREVDAIEAVDFFLGPGLALVKEHAGLPAPFEPDCAAYVVVSCAARSDPAPALAAALDRASGVRAVAAGQSAQQARALWSYRELHNAAINAAGVPHKLDVAVPPERVPELIERVDAWLASERAGARGIHYGHLADGNVHVNVLGAPPGDDAVDEDVLRIAADLGGSVAAEHGIGRAKTRWLHLSRSPGEIAAMRAVKAALDPNGILNPGKLLPA